MNDILPSIVLHPGELAPFPLNANFHPPAQVDELAASRDRFSQYRNVVVWTAPADVETSTADGKAVHLKRGITYVIAGNGFHQASLKRQDDSIEVKDYSHLTLEEAVLLAETDNAAPLGAQRLMAQVKANLDRARDLYVDDERLKRMFERLGVNGSQQSGNDVEPQIDKAAELAKVWGTKMGQIWELGQHRLAVGDCTDRATVEAVMRREKVSLYVTDPPYGVNYGDKNRHLSEYDKSRRILTDIEGDQSEGGIQEVAEKLWRPAFAVMFDVAKPGCVYYMTAPQGGDQMMMMMMMMMSEKWLVKHELIWVKDRMVFGRADYHYQHEPIIYGWKPGAAHYFVNDRTQVSIWQINRPGASPDHPTTKPVALFEKAMANSSMPGDICADFFMGSGTAIVAAQNLNRCARCIEIDPGYAAVAIQRYVDLGNTQPPRLVSG